MSRKTTTTKKLNKNESKHFDDKELEKFIERFKKIPKRMEDIDFTCEFELSSEFVSANEKDCQAIGLRIGETVRLYSWRSSFNCDFYAEGDLAEQLLDIELPSKLKVMAETKFGIKYECENELFDEPQPDIVKGCLIKKILEINGEKQ